MQSHYNLLTPELTEAQKIQLDDWMVDAFVSFMSYQLKYEDSQKRGIRNIEYLTWQKWDRAVKKKSVLLDKDEVIFYLYWDKGKDIKLRPELWCSYQFQTKTVLIVVRHPDVGSLLYEVFPKDPSYVWIKKAAFRQRRKKQKELLQKSSKVTIPKKRYSKSRPSRYPDDRDEEDEQSVEEGYGDWTGMDLPTDERY